MTQPISRSALPRSAILAIVVLGIAVAVGSASASDGVIEINQARALAGGVTATDAPGFPVTLDATGSYALTSNLAVGADLVGISIVANDVTLDLRGFTIEGSCPPPTCAVGAGIVASSPAHTGVHVRNGRVRNFANQGVSIVGPRARIVGLQVERTGLSGVETGSQADVVESKSNFNTRFGFEVGSGSKVRRCVADSNGYGGFAIASHSIVSDSAARSTTTGNGPSFGHGIAVGAGVLVQGNVASANLRQGIHADTSSSGGLILGNAVFSNSGSGIALLSPGSVQQNVTRGNVVVGLSLPGSASSRSAYRDNVVDEAPGHTVSSSGVNLGGNSCNGTTSCP